jgi:hypothetical protein
VSATGRRYEVEAIAGPALLMAGFGDDGYVVSAQ